MNNSIAVEAEPGSSSNPYVASCGEGRFVLRCPAEMAWRACVELVDSLAESAGDVTLRELILDLGDVGFLNSAGVGAIFSVRKHVIGGGGTMVICNVKPAVKRLLAAVNLPALIPMLGDLGLAHSFLDQGRGAEQ